MENENEKQLTEADLSAVKNSIAALCKKYIAGSFFDKLVDSSGIKIAKDILLGDLKEQIGHGTAAKAAEKFANAIQLAKNTPAVDTILANYMLKGDGMGTGIGYTESVESAIKPFQEFLSEARKNEKIETKPSEDLITEAIKTVEAEGYKVEEKTAGKYTEAEINEAIDVAKANGYEVITPKMIEEAKKIAEENGYKVVEESEKKEEETLNEAEKVTDAKLVIHVYDYDVEEVADLIKFALEDIDAPTYLRNEFGDVEKVNGDVVVQIKGAEKPAEDLGKLISFYKENNPGLESEYDEDLLDYYGILLKKAVIV